MPHPVGRAVACNMRYVLALVLLAGTAHAESEHGSITAGIGFDAEPALNAAFTLDGSYRIGWLAVRAIGSRGVAAAPGDALHGGIGAFRRYVGGVEGRWCGERAIDLAVADSACAYLGLDAGYERQHIAYHDGGPSYDSHGAVLATRLGMYAVYRRLVVRGAFVFMLHDEHATEAPGWHRGLGIEASLGFRL